MVANKLLRQVHRWTSIVFTAGVVVNMIAVVMKVYERAPWVGLFALLPLIVLLGTGLYLFVLPYLARKRG